MTTIGERILLSLSMQPSEKAHSQADMEDSERDPLGLLLRVYADFPTLVSGKRVVDFGCGVGHQSIALAKQFGCTVLGIDSNRQTLRRAIANAERSGVSPSQVEFVEAVSREVAPNLDVVISKDSFEHFSDPVGILEQMKALISPSGVIFITFGPPWFAPYGSHMHFFCRVPWINLLFSETTVMRVRGRFRSDGATRYEEVESGLNKMTVRKFESIIASCGLRVTYRRYDCVKGKNFLANIPLIRELFINQVTVVLARSR